MEYTETSIIIRLTKKFYSKFCKHTQKDATEIIANKIHTQTNGIYIFVFGFSANNKWHLTSKHISCFWF